MIIFKDNKFYEIVVGGVNKETSPKAGDSVDVYSSDLGIEHNLLRYNLTLRGNRIENIVKNIPRVRQRTINENRRNRSSS